METGKYYENYKMPRRRKAAFWSKEILRRPFYHLFRPWLIVELLYGDAVAFIQRGLYGYSPRRDSWNLCGHLSGIIVGACQDIAKNAVGHPISMCDENGECDNCGTGCQEKWKAILLEIAEGFDTTFEDNIFKDPDFDSVYYEPGPKTDVLGAFSEEGWKLIKEREAANQKKLDEALLLLKEYFQSLWD